MPQPIKKDTHVHRLAVGHHRSDSTVTTGFGRIVFATANRFSIGRFQHETIRLRGRGLLTLITVVDLAIDLARSNAALRTLLGRVVFTSQNYLAVICSEHEMIRLSGDGLLDDVMT